MFIDYIMKNEFLSSHSKEEVKISYSHSLFNIKYYLQIYFII